METNVTLFEIIVSNVTIAGRPAGRACRRRRIAVALRSGTARSRRCGRIRERELFTPSTNAYTVAPETTTWRSPMKIALGMSFLLLVAPVAQGADIDAGKAKVATVCAACHGPTGVSVSDSIPNLAAQRAGYLEAQLKALKDGTRKNPIMNAVAAQRSADEMANVAAYFSAQPGAEKGAKSGFLPGVARTHVTFPEGYKDTFAKYHTINFPATKQVRHYYANKAAVQAAREGKPLPAGSVLFVEVYAAKLDAEQKPGTGSDGFYVADKLVAYTAMASGA